MMVMFLTYGFQQVAMRDHMGRSTIADPDPRLGNATIWQVKCFGRRGGTWIEELE